MDKQLSHERLIVYQRAIQFMALAVKIIKAFPRGYAEIADQLRRASTSTPFNIAEGAGKNTRPDGARYFAIARGSALECGAILDACRVLKVAEDADIGTGKELLFEIVSMLSKMCR